MPVGHVQMFSFVASQTLARVKMTAAISSGVGQVTVSLPPSRRVPRRLRVVVRRAVDAPSGVR